MPIRPALLAIAVALTASISTHAQGRGQAGPPQNNQQLAAEIANLQARVSKLEGNITAADLAGTYVVNGIAVGLKGGSPAVVSSVVLTGTFTMAADGTGSSNVIFKGFGLVQGSPWQLGPVNNGDGTTPMTWTYANGVVTWSDGTSFTVAAGGRVLVAEGSDLESDNTGLPILVIATRLN